MKLIWTPLRPSVSPSLPVSQIVAALKIKPVFLPGTTPPASAAAAAAGGGAEFGGKNGAESVDTPLLVPADSAPSSDDMMQAVAFLQYTSGSTSDPKGVMIRHVNMAHNMMFIRR